MAAFHFGLAANSRPLVSAARLPRATRRCHDPPLRRPLQRGVVRGRPRKTRASTWTPPTTLDLVSFPRSLARALARRCSYLGGLLLVRRSLKHLVQERRVPSAANSNSEITPDLYVWCVAFSLRRERPLPRFRTRTATDPATRLARRAVWAFLDVYQSYGEVFVSWCVARRAATWVARPRSEPKTASPPSSPRAACTGHRSTRK